MTRSTRRDFLKTVAAAGATAWPAAAWAGPLRLEERKLNLGLIGTGGRGRGNTNAVRGENIVAVCDVDRRRLAAAAKRFPEARPYVDYRRLLERKDLDGVVISTPDHHHAPAAIRAIRRGLHVYCEKPLTHTVQEARLLAHASREAGVVTQMGTQNHAHPGYVRTVELIRAGAIGEVQEVHVITDRPGRWWKQGMARPEETPPVPEDLEWDTWLGPAPMRPYHEAYAHFRWRGWWDFGCGAIGDMAIHLMDPAVWALELGGRPVHVRTEGSAVLAESGPTWMKAHFDFAAHGGKPGVKVHWYEGTATPEEDVARDLPMNGSLFVGERGRLAVKHGRGGPRLLPEKDFEDFDAPPETLERPTGQHAQWISACKGDGKAASSFDGYAGAFTEVVLLGNVAFRTGKPIEWDPERGRVINHDAANRLITKSYRDGWGVG